MNTALETAQYFLHLAAEHGDELDEPTLQRLCFYAQGYNLAMRHEPLFGEAIEICDEGPVISELREAFGSCRASTPDDEAFDFLASSMLRSIYDNFRARSETDRITAEQADFVLDVFRRGETPLSFERCMAVSFWAAIERSPRTPPPAMSDEELEASLDRGRADVAAGRYVRYR